MIKPLVSIIVPCYNQAQYLPEALQSVLNQEYINWECIIVNDGSPDRTEKVAQQWLQKDSRFKYIYKENGGVSSARNCGVEMASGEFILPLDADDKIGKIYLQLAVDAFENNTQLKLVYCKAEKFGDVSEEWILEPFSLQNLTLRNMIFVSAIFKKQDWKKINGFDVNMTSGLEDWEFWIALLKNGGDVFRIDKVAFYYRIKNSSRQIDLKNQEKDYLFEYLSIKHADFFVRHFGSFKKIAQEKMDFKNKLKSEKFIIDLFSSKFFGFSIFGKYKKNKSE